MQPLLRTRTTVPPTRPRQVTRHSLLTRLQSGVERALTLIVAPAGFGKTCLAAAWAQLGRMPVAWLSLQPGDEPRDQFLTYLIQALQTIDPRLGQSSLVLLQSGDFEVALFALVNDLVGFESDLALILDDFHTVQTAEINDILQFILENRPAGFHLVLLSRTVPDLPLTRLRALDQVVEIVTADLRFSPVETETFLEEIMHLHLPAETRLRLDQATEGWPVGLQLAAIALAHDPSDARILSGQQHIFEYLADEVLKREPPEVQEFLKRTSLYDRFCLPMVEFLYSDSDCQTGDCSMSAGKTRELLAYIEKSNLFLIQLDSNWYRYHGLFTDFLRPLVPAEHRIHLYSSASRWMEQNGLYTDAIHYAIHADEFERAAVLLESRYLEMLQHGEQTFLRELITEFPDDFLEKHPRLWVARGWTYVISMDSTLTDECIRHAEQAAGLLGILPEIEGELLCLRLIANIFSGHYADPAEMDQVMSLLQKDDEFLTGLVYFGLGLNYVISGNTGRVIETLQQALERLDVAHNPLVAIFTRVQLGETRQIRGALGLAERTLQEAIRFTHETLGEHSLLAGLPYISYAELLREENRMEDALRYARQGVAYCQIWQPITSLDGLITLARILAAQNQWDEAFELLDMAMTMAAKSVSILDDRIVAIQQARLALLHNDLIKARYYIRYYNLEQPDTPQFYYFEELSQMVIQRARIQEAGARAEGLEDVLAALEKIQTSAEENERMSVRVECLILSSYAYHALQRHDEAIDSLSRAVSICAQCGYLRILLDEGGRLLHLLRQYRSQLRVPFAYMEQLMSLFTTENAPHAAPRRLEDGLSPLTRRELEVLSLLAAGKSNQEIADECTLTLNTVKKHVANILSKLGVANRTQAVLLARRSGWVTEK